MDVCGSPRPADGLLLPPRRLGRRHGAPARSGRGRRAVVINAQADWQERALEAFNPCALARRSRIRRERARQALEALQPRGPPAAGGVQPHFGTKWAADALGAAQGRLSQQAAQALGGVEVPQWLRDAQAQAAALERGLQAQLAAASSEAGGSSTASSLRAALDSVAQLQASIAQQAERILSSAGASASPAAAEPHFGTRAAQRLLDSLGSGAASSDALAGYLRAAKAAGLGAEQQLQGLLSGLLPALSLQQLQLGGGQPGRRALEWLQALPGLTAGGADKLLAGLGAALGQAQLQADAQGFGGHSWGTLAGVAALLALATAASVPRGPAAADALPPLVYDRQAVADYWAQRPVAVLRRASVVAFEALWWGAGLGLDTLRGRAAVRRNARARAAALRRALERLGPAYVKVAQAVSTRVDLLEPEYLAEIELLQDRVPPFPNELAEATMARAFGRPSAQVFAALSASPLAAASLGQVYRGRLQPALGGAEVAVKVQRPGVLLSVAMDLFLMRSLAALLDSLFRTTWTGIIDEWAGRFFDELDYSREAANAVAFKRQMAALPGIFVPEVLPQLCSQEVLTTAWVQGEKLGESNAGDVRQLCSTLLNCYLVQLLETGFLHADPHPGNLLRTPEGKICILDYGLMTRIEPSQSIALVEYIAHLTTEDYEAIPGDLYKLGFIPEGAPDPRESGLVQPLSKILRQLAQGGGAKALNLDEVTAEMEDLTRRYPFQVPSYFALILRAFSVIEGIALRADPAYSIVGECFPYMSRRLLTDNDPRVRSALRQVLYGEGSRLDLGRLQRMAAGFGSFTVDGLPAPAVDAVGDQPILNETAKEALRTLFRREGSYIQEVFVEESAAATDAVGRELASGLSRALLGSPPAVASLSLVQALGPWRPLLLPMLTPLELLSRVAPRIAPTEEDQQALATARTLASLLQPPAAAGPAGAGAGGQDRLRFAAQLARELQPLLPELLPGVAATGELFARALVRRVALRIAGEAGRPLGAAPASPGAAAAAPQWAQGPAAPQK